MVGKPPGMCMYICDIYWNFVSQMPVDQMPADKMPVDQPVSQIPVDKMS